MRWPPNKSWTSISIRNGFRHFVAINYGGKGRERWANLVAVLDGKTRFRVSRIELMDSSKWVSGWLQLPKEEAIDTSSLLSKLYKNEDKNLHPCLHASKDSGLNIPIDHQFIRPWS